MKTTLKLFFAASVLLASCNSKQQMEEIEKDVIRKTYYDSINDSRLDIVFDSLKNTATLYFEGDTIVLKGQKPASGFWYKEGTLELRGKGEDFEFFNLESVLFVHKEPKEEK